jgi:hypothetical protein
LVIGACVLSGCASAWEQNYLAESWAPATDPPSLVCGTAPIQLRQAPWDRVQATLVELADEVSKSDVSPTEWPTERRAAAKARLLTGLQVSENSATITVLGRSSFRDTRLLEPEGRDARDLDAFARRIGACRVVWARSVLGKTETMIDRPITTHSSQDLVHHDRLGRLRTTTYTETTTTWVPVRVEADEYGYIAFFLR